MKQFSFKNLKLYRFRLLSIFLFFIFLISTWFLFYRKADHPRWLYTSLQDQLKTMIQTNLTEDNENIQFHKLSTKSTDKRDQIKVLFQYSFTDKKNVDVTVEGTALMKRSHSKSFEMGNEVWIVSSMRAKHTNVILKEPIALLFDQSQKDFGENSEIGIEEKGSPFESKEPKTVEEQ